MNFDIVRAWKDEEYRQSLNEEQFNSLPANPAGDQDLANAELESVNGGTASFGGFGGHGGVFAASTRIQSFTLGQNSCDNFEFSLTVVTAPNLLSPIQPFCVNNQR